MIRMELDAKGFNACLDDYMKVSKRSPSDIINAKLFFIARNATMTTKASTKAKIQEELMANSSEYPTAPLAAILVNKQLGKAGEKGLYGKDMAKAIEKFIKKRIASINFIRSGWKNAIQIIEQYLKTTGEFKFVRRWQSSAPVNKDVMKRRVPRSSGIAFPASVYRQERVWGEIQNNLGGDGKESLGTIKKDGLQKAIDKETASMRIYIERKLNDMATKFNR